MESPAFYIALFVHLAALILGFGSVLVTDLYGLLWLRDRVRFTQVVKVSGVTEWFIWAGWILMVLAGIPLILLKGEIDNLMILKLFFVIVIGVNGVPLHHLQKKLRGVEDGDEVSRRFMFRLMLSLFVSQVAWWSAVLIGFLHRHVQSVIDWPPQPWPWVIIGGFLALLALLWLAGEKLLRGRAEV